MDKLSVDEKDAMFVFRYLLVMVATLESIARGANDTANATGPIAAISNVYDNGYGGSSNHETPVWIMPISGCLVCLSTIFHGAPLKLAVSTTHCQVGLVLFVSLVNPGWRIMSFLTMGKILLSWLLTAPTAGAVAVL
ncbi:Inorganic phosphate transporter family [Phytophthora cinnamomi]|uniref:Inorganic phosphate transporter family n=1 Tax=Phytophthora cinnamomi TaxID=4785 RepID=UPI00355A2987|nr:Inorganic phosphate transporter family [Phytophthora cinnamomi]